MTVLPGPLPAPSSQGRGESGGSAGCALLRMRAGKHFTSGFGLNEGLPPGRRCSAGSATCGNFCPKRSARGTICPWLQRQTFPLLRRALVAVRRVRRSLQRTSHPLRPIPAGLRRRRRGSGMRRRASGACRSSPGARRKAGIICRRPAGTMREICGIHCAKAKVRRPTHGTRRATRAAHYINDGACYG